MNQNANLLDAMTEVAAAIGDRLLQSLPSLAGALLLLLAGWVLAKVLRALTGRVVVGLDALAARTFGDRISRHVRLARSASVLGALVFWAVLLVFVMAATNVLGLSAFTEWLARLMDYLPALFAGIAIVVAGYVFSRVVADVILRAPGPLTEAQRLAAARAAQATILIAALLVGAEQIGIRVTFLAVLIGVAGVAVAGGVIVAISLGARTHVANLIGVHQLGRRCELGQRIAVAGFEGRVLEVSPQAVLLETEQGTVSLPGHIFSEQPVVLLTKTSGDG